MHLKVFNFRHLSWSPCPCFCQQSGQFDEVLVIHVTVSAERGDCWHQDVGCQTRNMKIIISVVVRELRAVVTVTALLTQIIGATTDTIVLSNIVNNGDTLS